MSVTTQARAGQRSPSGVAGWLSSFKQTLDRPLTSYYLLFGASSMLLAIGLIMVLSASSVYSFTQYHSSYHIFLKQLTWVLLALPLAYVATRVPRMAIRRLSWAAVGVSIVLLALTQTGLGVVVNGNRNWLSLGPVLIQPSEIAKLAIIIWSADVYARKEKLLDDWRHTVLPVVPVVGLIAVLVIVEHDLGTALVLFAIMLGMLWVVGAPARLFGISFSIIGVSAFFLATTSPERRSRLTSFTDPMKHFQDQGWQAGHGLLGMASGGIFGKGLSASQQKWGNLPEAHTDFIYAVLGEELGLVGTLLVLALFLTITYAAVRLAMQTRDPFVRYVTAGITIWLMAQMMINIGMVLALLPVIGIPLPLVSYGGSGLLPSVIGLGLMIGFARSEPEAADALRDKRRGRKSVRPGINAGARPRRGQ
ncbi:MAG: cell division-specific peptidoglycan biosynthesis regulator FtsW [Marmoricola sp.]|nr:cell division-specific peptidoglycan biosynthesis regulator FtsW [Marmoricola sp.]